MINALTFKLKMAKHKFFFVVLLSIFSFSSMGQMSNNRLEILVPNIEQEASSIWRTINDISFLENQGYKINLPESSLIDTLVTKSRNGTFSNADFSSIYDFVETNVFQVEDYKKAAQIVESEYLLINKLIGEIDSSKNKWDWDFKMFDTYKIIFTHYGTGGSYDINDGTITLLTNKEGNFIGYKNPSNTIIHEITHMGMEFSIVEKFKLSHGLKERVVDTFVYLMFHEMLPEYRVQNMGDVDLDKHLRSKEDISSLISIISELLDE